MHEEILELQGGSNEAASFGDINEFLPDIKSTIVLRKLLKFDQRNHQAAHPH